MRSIVMSAVGILMLGATAQPAQAIPAFARKYRVSCSMCHSPAPRLNDFGERFANNGFEFAPGEAPRDTINTGDPLLRLQNGLPLAVRLDAYISTLSRRANGQVVVDQKIPWGRSEEHTSELQSRENLVCRLLLEKKKIIASS